MLCFPPNLCTSFSFSTSLASTNLTVSSIPHNVLFPFISVTCDPQFFMSVFSTNVEAHALILVGSSSHLSINSTSLLYRSDLRTCFNIISFALTCILIFSRHFSYFCYCGRSIMTMLRRALPFFACALHQPFLISAHV